MIRIPLYWYRAKPNFGDAFSPLAVRHVLGCDIVPAGKWDCDLVAEGSVLGFTLLRTGDRVRGWLNRNMRRPLRVWGSGLLFPIGCGVRKNSIRRPDFLALRGARTFMELRALGLLDAHADVALGDPGIFMPEVLNVGTNGRRGRGFVMHAVSWENGEARLFAKEHPDIRLIDPRRPPCEVVRDIASCEEVFSSSLHGLVAADSLGIPNRWVELETPHADVAANRFKFEDYYSAFDMSRTPCRMRDVATEVPDDPVPAETIDACKAVLSNALIAAYGANPGSERA